MARLHNIPDNLVPPLLQKSNEGLNANQLSEWLRETHGVIAERSTISNRLRAWKKLEHQAKKEAIQEAAANSAIDCVKFIDTNIAILNKEAMCLLASDKNSDKALGDKLANTLLKYIDKKMNLSGMDNKDEMSIADQELLEGLLRKIGTN